MKYKGEATMWRHWLAKVTTFLARRDARWPDLLSIIRENSKDPLTEDTERALARKICIVSDTLFEKFKGQFYE